MVSSHHLADLGSIALRRVHSNRCGAISDNHNDLAEPIFPEEVLADVRIDKYKQTLPVAVKWCEVCGTQYPGAQTRLSILSTDQLRRLQMVDASRSMAKTGLNRYDTDCFGLNHDQIHQNAEQCGWES